MNFAFLFIFLLLQVVVNNVLSFALASVINTLYGRMAFYMLSSLIIAFFAAIFAVPAGYRKEFYKQPGFHKIMLIYFLVFFALDLIMLFL